MVGVLLPAKSSSHKHEAHGAHMEMLDLVACSCLCWGGRWKDAKFKVIYNHILRSYIQLKEGRRCKDKKMRGSRITPEKEETLGCRV